MNFNNIRSAKQLTFVYFAGLAFAIIVFHFSLFNSTLEDLEALNAKNRLNKDLQLALPALDLGTKSLTVSPYSSVFVGLESLPENVSLPDPLELNTLYEIDDYDSRYYDFFIMKTKRQVMGKMQDIYLLHYDDVYELSEEQMFQTQYKQMLFSLILLGISLFIILKVSDRLTSPLSKLSKELKQRSVNHFEPLSLPDGGATKEIWQLTSRINEYQEKIKRLVERERAFTRYASHELRSPLMVMKGAISLLGHSKEPEFVERQRLRLDTSTQEMDLFVTTLLSLTREEKIEAPKAYELKESCIETIIKTHQHLLEDKPVNYLIQSKSPCMIKVPESIIQILVGNMIKNAFSCTFEGSIRIELDQNSISVIDTGIGLKDKPEQADGFGLGLLIVKDICQKYDWHFSLIDNPDKGCTACIHFD